MAGQASNPISVNQAPQYGDRKALDALKAQTTTPMTGVPTPAPTAGRPRGSASPPQASQGADGAGQGATVPAEHASLFDQFAQAMRAAQILAQAAQQPDAGPWTKFYASVADKQYKDLATKVRTETPFLP